MKQQIVIPDYKPYCSPFGTCINCEVDAPREDGCVIDAQKEDE